MIQPRMVVPNRNSIRDQCNLSVPPARGWHKPSDACCSAVMARYCGKSARFDARARTLTIRQAFSSCGLMLRPLGSSDDGARRLVVTR